MNNQHQPDPSANQETKGFTSRQWLEMIAGGAALAVPIFFAIFTGKIEMVFQWLLAIAAAIVIVLAVIGAIKDGRAKQQKTEEKSLAWAIIYNLLIPGMGYVYLGRWVLGIAIFALMIIVASSPGGMPLAIPTWIALNVIIVLHMYIISKRIKGQFITENTKTCPACAELIKKEAHVCRFCGLKQD